MYNYCFGLLFPVTTGIFEQGHAYSVIPVESLNRRTYIVLYLCFIAQ